MKAGLSDWCPKPVLLRLKEKTVHPFLSNSCLINIPVRILVLLFLGFLVSGCSSSKGTVSGKVFYKGKPLPKGSVTFLLESGGAYGSGIKADGSYTIEKVPAGKVKIIVTVPSQAKDDPRMAMMKQAMKSNKLEISEEAKKDMPAEFKSALEEPGSSGAPISIPKHYSDPEKSGLELIVTGGQQNHDIELK
jgi:hypothetical protein